MRYAVTALAALPLAAAAQTVPAGWSAIVGAITEG
jgi:hypothetical protein